MHEDMTDTLGGIPQNVAFIINHSTNFKTRSCGARVAREIPKIGIRSQGCRFESCQLQNLLAGKASPPLAFARAWPDPARKSQLELPAWSGTRPCCSFPSIPVFNLSILLVLPPVMPPPTASQKPAKSAAPPKAAAAAPTAAASAGSEEKRALTKPDQAKYNAEQDQVNKEIAELKTKLVSCLLRDTAQCTRASPYCESGRFS